MRVLDIAGLEPVAGLVGDHYAGRSGSREVSLIGEENLAAIGAFLGSGPASPALLRRNIVTTGINLLALKGRRFRLGTAILAYAGECHPCSRMELLLGTGGYNAVRGQGGILARVLEAGRVEIGDALIRLEDDPAQAMLAL
jgi:MOSC domain-containing protein YiiM